MLKRLLFTALCLSNLAISPAQAQTEDPDAWKFNGQVLIRGEMDGRDFTQATPPIFFTVMRTRLALSKGLFNRKIELFAQLQDSRTLGEAENTIFNLKNIDLYQGFLQFNQLFEQDLAFQVGRFELEYGNTRLFSPLPGWNYLGQAFDGARLKYRRSDWFDLHTDLFATVIKPTSNAIRNPNPTAYTVPAAPDEGRGVYGLWSSARFAPEAKVDAFAYYEQDRKQTTPGAWDVNRWTIGLNHQGKYLDGLVSSAVDLDGQFGSVGNKSLAAYLLSLQAYIHPGDFKIGGGFDMVSGTAPSNTTASTSFDQGFGNNHAFYGFMDYFLNIPRNTKGLGLNDAYLKAAWQSPDLPVEVALDLHHLMANQTASNNQSVFGQEADLTVTYKQGNNRYIWGLSGFLPGGLFSSDLFFGTNRNQPAYWSYLMAIVNF
jgi:hypothetical protein